MTFEEQLRELINKNSQEAESNTPDFILAQFLQRCLTAFNIASAQKTAHESRGKKPG